jgi:hypothetical protein
MLTTTLFQILYAVMATAHNLMFVLFFVGLIRIFTVKHTPYNAYYVGLYAMLNSAYNGCPLLEIQNYLARHFDGGISKLGAYHNIFGQTLGDVVRAAVFLGGAMMVYYAYHSWDQATLKVNWRNIFQRFEIQSPLTVSA